MDVQFPDGAPVEVGDLQGIIIAFAENRSFFSRLALKSFCLGERDINVLALKCGQLFVFKP